MTAVVPEQILTARLRLRPYRPEDAIDLQPILAGSGDYLSAWLPSHVWEPVPVDELCVRLRLYADLFASNVEWRYAAHAGEQMVGSVCLFPRNASGRVPLADADRVEIGYWIRRDRSGEGLASEASRAMVDLARTLDGITQVEIRCDRRNAASAGVPRRLGFELSEVDGAGAPNLQVWTLPIAPMRSVRR